MNAVGKETIKVIKGTVSSLTVPSDARQAFIFIESGLTQVDFNGETPSLTRAGLSAGAEISLPRNDRDDSKSILKGVRMATQVGAVVTVEYFD